MKKITYKERSKFYASEVEKTSDELELLKAIKNKYNISSVIICPCASGVYLEECSMNFEISYFIDIEKNMIDIINNNIIKHKITNIKTNICNMMNLNELNIKCNCIFALRQGIQYLNYSEFEVFLNNAYFVTDYIVLELFDFNLNGLLTYYNSKIKDGYFYFSKNFEFENKNIKRYNKHVHNGSSVEFYYKYFDKNNLIFKTNFRLYNYKYELTKEIIEKNNKFNIQEKIKRSNGSYIIVLNKKGRYNK